MFSIIVWMFTKNTLVIPFKNINAESLSIGLKDVGVSASSYENNLIVYDANYKLSDYNTIFKSLDKIGVKGKSIEYIELKYALASDMSILVNNIYKVDSIVYRNGLILASNNLSECNNFIKYMDVPDKKVNNVFFHNSKSRSDSLSKLLNNIGK